MKVKIRTVQGAVTVMDVSKAMLVEDFRKLVFEATGIEPSKQRLLFRGKQLEDGCELVDYKVEVGTIVDVMERAVLKEVDQNSSKSESKVDDGKVEPERKKPKRDENALEDPAPSTSSSSSPPSASKDEASQHLELLKELCPELANEVQESEKEYVCDKCKNNSRRKCKECGCTVCGGKDDEATLLFCEQCEYVTHMKCLKPPLEEVPEDDWYCPDCKNDANEIVQAGELGTKFSKRKNKDSTAKKRDWGKGLATAGRTKTCTLVPINHFGPIPGIDVGMCWEFRLQVSEEGIHRPPVAGIAGRAEEGCQSIVLAGGYEDDTDNGLEFFYTGCGGRDLSGNKRTAKEQSSDQTLERMNLAIARNCNAPIDRVKGAEAKGWQKGKPIRVVRSAKMKGHSNYAPEKGYRYDGLYKVVKYWPETTRSGFVVWRYLLRRDDPSLAPWEAGAKKYECIPPDIEKEPSDGKPAKKIKGERFVPDDETRALMEADKLNESMWNACLEFDGDKKDWFDHVESTFGCVVCICLLKNPVTLPCNHNICFDCLNNSFKAGVYTCPHCREDLGKGYSKVVNKTCQAALEKIFKV